MTDPLAIAIQVQGVDSTMPILPEADYVFQVKESKVEPNKDENGFNWKLVLGLTQEQTAVDGRPIKADFPVFVTNALQPRPDSTDPEAFKRSIAETIDALYGTNKDTRPNLDRELVANSVGKLVVAHVYVDEYPKNSGRFSNKVKRLKSMPDPTATVS